jgi:site-specific DNA-methyltransferase (adenine-specific)
MRIHKVAKLFPPMSDEEFAAFKADVAANGLREPVWTYQGEVIDGRNRLRACKELGIEVPTRAWDGGDGSPEALVTFVVGQNLNRRHLTTDQKATLAVDIEAALAKAAKERQREGGARGGRASGASRRGEPKSTAIVPEPPPGERPRELAAKLTGASARYVQGAKKVKEKSPAAFEKVKAGEMTLSQAKRQVAREEKMRELESKAKAARKIGEQPWQIVVGDCLDELAKVKEGSARLVFADPPYNIGVNYGGGEKKDRLPEMEYLAWCVRWFAACYRTLAPDGSFWVLINNENCAWFDVPLRSTFRRRGNVDDSLDFLRRMAEGGAWQRDLFALLCEEDTHTRARLTWFESFGVNCSHRFNRCSRRLFWCDKDKNNFVFNPDPVTRPSDRQAKYGDARADPGGKLWDDVWGINPPIPRLTGTCAERIPDFPTQLPLALLNPIVGCASDPGDLVIDPFSGSATTGEAAVTQGRRYLGIEKSEKFARLATLRLQGLDA